MSNIYLTPLQNEKKLRKTLKDIALDLILSDGDIDDEYKTYSKEIYRRASFYRISHSKNNSANSQRKQEKRHKKKFLLDLILHKNPKSQHQNQELEIDQFK